MEKISSEERKGEETLLVRNQQKGITSICIKNLRVDKEKIIQKIFCGSCRNVILTDSKLRFTEMIRNWILKMLFSDKKVLVNDLE